MNFVQILYTYCYHGEMVRDCYWTKSVYFVSVMAPLFPENFFFFPLIHLLHGIFFIQLLRLTEDAWLHDESKDEYCGYSSF